MAARKLQAVATAQTSLLSALAFSNDEPVAATPAQQDPKAMRIQRFVDACELQRKLVAADIAGTKFSMTRKHYVVVKGADGKPETNADGSVKKELKEEPTDKFRRWYWSINGNYFIRPRYSVRVVEIQPGKPTIACGKQLGGVDNVLLSLISAAKANDPALVAALMKLQLGRKGQ